MRVLFVIAMTSLVSSLASEAQPTNDEHQREPTTRPLLAEPSGQLDEPPALRDDATASNVDQADQEAELCSRCYDKVKLASDLLGLYENLLKKQKRLISRKKAAADAAAAASRSTNEDVQSSSARSPKNPRSAPAAMETTTTTTTTSTSTTNTANSTWGLRVRTLEPMRGEIVVHRLRVARSPATAVEQYDRSRAAAYSKLAGRKDLELEKLKREQQAKKEAVCQALQEARDCLEPIERQCLGDLNFHTNELFVEQSLQQYRCPFRNSPLKPLNISLRRLEDQVQAPQARQISSEQEVRSRMHQILPDWAPFGKPARRLGVVLTPTAAATPRFLKQQQQQQQPAAANVLRPRHEPQPDISVNWLRVPAAALACGLAITLLLLVAWYELK